LSLDRPADLDVEYETRAELLTRLFRDEHDLEPDERATFKYLPPPPPCPPCP
jgi:hypothetical protein